MTIKSVEKSSNKTIQDRYITQLCQSLKVDAVWLQDRTNKYLNIHDFEKDLNKKKSKDLQEKSNFLIYLLSCVFFET